MTTSKERKAAVKKGLPYVSQVVAFNDRSTAPARRGGVSAVTSMATGSHPITGSSAAYRAVLPVADGFHVDAGQLFGIVCDDLAAWLARLAPPARLAAIGQDHERQVRRVRSMARQTAKKMATGNGTMPRLVPIADVAETAKKVEVVTRLAKLIALRTLSAVEQAEWVRQNGYERAESTVYSPWLDGMGDTSPEIGSPHPFGGPAPAQPARDASHVRSASLVELVSYLASQKPELVTDCRLVTASLDSTTTTRMRQHDCPENVKNCQPEDCRHTGDCVHLRSATGDCVNVSVDWGQVASLTGDSRHRSTLQRAVRRTVRLAMLVTATSTASGSQPASDSQPAAASQQRRQTVRHQSAAAVS